MSKKQIQKLKNSIVQQQIEENDQKIKISISIASKVSQSGYFNNERMLLLDHKDKKLGYFTKVPKGYPLITRVDLGLAKVINNLDQLDVQKDLLKSNLLRIRWKNNKKQWVFQMSSHKLVVEWIQLIYKVIAELQLESKHLIERSQVDDLKSPRRFGNCEYISPLLMTYSEVINTILPTVINKQHHSWGQEWYHSSADAQHQIYQSFVRTSTITAKEIIDQLLTPKKNRKYSPLQQDAFSYIFQAKGISFKVNLWLDETQLLKLADEDSPLLYDHRGYWKIQQQFSSYELIFIINANKCPIKVPAVCLLHYRSIMILCQSIIPQNYQRIDKANTQELIKQIDNIIGMPINGHQYQLYGQEDGQFVVIGDVSCMIPKIPGKDRYFTKQQLMSVLPPTVLTSSGYHLYAQNRVHSFIQQYEQSNCVIVSTHDLSHMLHQNALSRVDLSILTKHITSAHLRRVILSEICALIFVEIVRSQINSLLVNFPIYDLSNPQPQTLNNVVLDCMHLLINGLLGYTTQSQQIWKVIVAQTHRRYDFIVSKQDVIPGYMLAVISHQIGLNINYQQINFTNTYFTKDNIISKSALQNLYVRTYTYPTFNPIIKDVRHILTKNQYNAYELINEKIHLETQAIPQYLKAEQQQILLLCSNFISYHNRNQYSHLHIYDKVCTKMPYNYQTFQICLNAIKWCLKKGQFHQAASIFIKTQQIMKFWCGQENPLLCQLYEVQMLHQQTLQQYDEAIQFAQKSLQMHIKDHFPQQNQLTALQKYYKLGKLYLAIQRKNQALKMYQSSISILQNAHRTELPLYCQLLVQIATLQLNLGHVLQSLNNCEKALAQLEDDEQKSIRIYELMGRSYETNLDKQELLVIGQLCARRYNNTQCISVLKTMIKMFIFPRLCLMSFKQATNLLRVLFILEKYTIQFNQPQKNQLRAFQFLKNIAKTSNIMVNFSIVLAKIVNLCTKMKEQQTKIMKKCQKWYESQQKSQTQTSLLLLRAIADIVGYEYLVGSINSTI